MEVLAQSGDEVGSKKRRTAAFRPAVVVTVAMLAVSGDTLLCCLCPVTGRGHRSPGVWTLPRLVPEAGESLDTAAARLVSQGTGVTEAYVEQLHTSSSAPDGEGRSLLEVTYLGLAPPPEAGEDQPGPGPRWWPVEDLPELVPGHREMLERAHGTVRQKLSHTTIAWSLLPGEFALSDLQRVYEVFQGRALDKRNFRKWILATGALEATPHERRDGAHRPARLYRFIRRESSPLL